MMKQAVLSNKLKPPDGTFSAALRGNGSIYISGQIGQDPATGELVAGDVLKQTENTFGNLALVLRCRQVVGRRRWLRGLSDRHGRPSQRRTRLREALQPASFCIRPVPR